MEIYRDAPILIFCFNRFKAHNVIFSEKMEDIVSFPVTGLDMAPYIKSSRTHNAIYDLHGVISHEGSLHVGHYFAFAKNSIT